MRSTQISVGDKEPNVQRTTVRFSSTTTTGLISQVRLPISVLHHHQVGSDNLTAG